MDFANFGPAQYIQASYIGSSIILLFLGLVSMNTRLPDFIWSMFVYGKLIDRKYTAKQELKSTRSIMQVPKSWFLHYYVVAILADGYSLSLVLTEECYAPIQVLLGVLMLFNSFRRLQESACVCVFSKATMHVSHYILGMGYYMSRNYLAQYALSSYYEATGEVQRSPPGALYSNICFSLHNLDWTAYLLTAVAFYSMAMQHLALVQLASLRKDPASRNKHMIPRGSTFKRVSCPHYFWELVLYTCFLLMVTSAVHTLFHAFTSVYILVIVNQSLSAIETHNWYLKSFRDYPKNRKALIPYVF